LPKAYNLPEDLRATLAKPLGRLFTVEELGGREFRELVMDSSFVVSVGDRVTETLGAMGRPPDVQIVDGMERRKKRTPPEMPYARLIEVENPAGTLTEEAIEGVRSAVSGTKPVRVLVDGEEDLVAIPAIAFAPESTIVFYGQPGEGIVAVKADLRAKARSLVILNAMGLPKVG
jgi:GTP-dependent dephospho-CoA kinase